MIAPPQAQQPPSPTTDPTNPNIQTWTDLGLTLIHNFITQAEEATMIDAFHQQDPLITPTTNPSTKPKPPKRISQHFGYHFDYTTFGASTTSFTPVPDYITSFLPRLPLTITPRDRDNNTSNPDQMRRSDHRPPDQFTVQYYPPGAGIPPHVDTHSMFDEALYSLSFGSAVPMQFRLAGANEARKMRLPKRSVVGGKVDEAPGKEMDKDGGEEGNGNQSNPKHGKAEQEDDPAPTWELHLPARSLLILTGPSRYGYTHGIRPRKTDIIDGQTVPRQGRYSITMRSTRRGDEIGCACAYPGVCDARIREEQEMAEGGS
ncbi:alkylated DNA repair protein alkB 8 [Dichotomopilus funicola]|uniref:Alkylated DNA repair protein alkB 8 n=1 Tax=Dichotomopilus funicola TaxID=1934379 RepID=A0AAN6ZIZ6_9PEZI|nr:alkylated DNA repair protein alkB 8 [Dichotomopilus funicola]